MKKIKKSRRLKKLSYIGKTTKFKKIISFMIVVGILCSGLYVCTFVYQEYAASRASIVLTFPQIAQSEYPDGSRFTYYDFISDQNLQAALDMMQAEGKYKNFTVDDLRDKFYIYSSMSSSARQSVSMARSEGNDFTYVANEYKITFIQPHDYKKEDVLERFIGPDYSSDFLNALIEVNRIRLAEELGGINSFENLTKVTDDANYDYSEELNVYRAKINAIRSYLKYLNKQDPDFIYTDGKLSLSDIEGQYDFLITNSLDGISNFVESSGISKDVELASNKLNVNIENNTLKYNKYLDRSQNNQYAMTNYDQTFTENLINVVQNDAYGLYQARPKTAFDTVVVQKHEADEGIVEYGAKISQYQNELDIYNTIEQTPEEHDRLINKCNKLMAQFKEDYQTLSENACKVVTAYFNDKNENFIVAKVATRKVLSRSLIMNTGIVFLLAAISAFAVAVAMTSVSDSKKLNRKRKLMKEIKRASAE